MRTNYDLLKFAEKYNIPLNNIVNKDNLKYENITQGGWIVNMEDSVDSRGNFTPGTHWVSFYVKGNKCVYFDSFGILPDIQIQKILCQYIPYRYSTKQIQNIRNGDCGDFCLFFIFFISRSTKSLDEALLDFQRLFSNNTAQNKQILVNLLKKYNLWYLK